MANKVPPIKMFFKTVMLPIRVSYTDYCWDHDRICGYFDNEGGHPSCALDIGTLQFDKEGKVPKPPKCLALEERS